MNLTPIKSSDRSLQAVIRDAKRNALVGLVSVLLAISGAISQGEFTAIRAAGYTDTQLAEITLAIGLIAFTKTFNRINDTDVDFPPAD